MNDVDYTQELSIIEGRPPLRELDDLIAKPLETKPLEFKGEASRITK